MKRPLLGSLGLKTILVGFVLMFFAITGAKSYCDFYTQYGWDGNNMALNFVRFDGNVIQRWDFPRDDNGNFYWYNSPNFYGYKDIDWNNQYMYAEKGKQYTMYVVAGAAYIYEDYDNPIDEGANFTPNYPMDIKVYIDFNQDGYFDEYSELAGQYDNQGSDNEEIFVVYIPSDARSGQTTVRIVCDYAYIDGGEGTFDACNSYYGEAKDYIMDIKAGFDIGLTKISAPTNPLLPGNQAVKAILHNYAAADVEALTYCQINWAVDGVNQTPYYWYGYLEGGQEQEVTLGNYNFKSKGVVTKYSISAYSQYPNYSDDGNASNDAAPTFWATMPLSVGIYYVGGTSYDFKTLSDATNMINSTGVVGSGDFVLRLRPGTYTGPFTMNNFSVGKVNFIFERDPATTGDVTITAASNSSNYTWYINNISNVTFRNLIFSATNPSGWGARIFMLRGNVDNYTFENNTFNGMNIIDQTAYKFSMIDCQASQMNNHRYYKNIFNNGAMSLVLINSLNNSKGLVIDQNIFNSFTNRAIHSEGIGEGVITKNTLNASSKSTNYGIFVKNGTVIKDNKIKGIVGNNSGGYGISVIHDAIYSPGVITDNTITECIGIGGILASGIDGGSISNNTVDLSNSSKTSYVNGIQLVPGNPTKEKVILSENTLSVENGYGIYGVNYTMDVLKNKIDINNTGISSNLSCVYTSNTSGMILLNELVGNNGAMEINNSNMFIAYNSTIALGSYETIKIQNGSNQLARNLFVNGGTGSAITMLSENDALLEGNDYLSSTGVLGTISGKNYYTVTDLLQLDKNARNDDPMYKTNYSLKVTEFHDELVFNYPLQNINWPEGYQALYEEKTFDGIAKNGSYYMGAYIIFPTLELIGFSDELIDCSGAPDRGISVSAATSTDQTPKYQWYKDGLLLQGETEHILKFEPFDYTVSATYTCSVYCPGANTEYTGNIPVYALTMPDIVEQPKEVVNAVVGKDYSFNVGVHYRGILPPFYKDAFQWYKYDAAKKDSVPLKNDSRFAGTTASDFTIKKLKDIDICKPGDFYFVKIEGECGTVYSDPFVISKTPDVVFRDHPENLNPCPGSDVVFISNAIVPEGFALTYKWMKDGVDLANNVKYNGVNTNKLQVFDVQLADQGNYVCVATIPAVPTSKNSNAGILKLRDIPTATATGETTITTKRGNNVTLLVNLIKGSEPLTVKWYYNGELIKEALWSIYDGDKLLTIVMEGANESQSGEYKCVLENDCDKTEIVYNVTVTKWDEAGSVEVISENGYSLYACAPNPSNGSTKIKFEMPETNNAVITLIDQSGRKVSTLFSGVANKGMNILDVNTNGLNISAGVYYYTINANGFNASMPMVIVK